MRLGVIDVGTNTVLLLVADRHPDGSLVAVAEKATITRLGEGVDRLRRLSPAAIARTNAALNDYRGIVDELRIDRMSVVGTSAMRDAGGGDAVRDHVRACFGVDARVLSGEEEARLTFRGATSGLAVDPKVELTVVDVGGGSTEVVLGRPGREPAIRYAESFDVGSVRLTERHVTHDPVTSAEIAVLRQRIESALGSVPSIAGDAQPIGVAGTVTTLAAVAFHVAPYEGALLHGRALTRGALEQVVERLARMPIDARRAVPGMEPKRADVIVAGGLIVLHLLEHWDAAALRVSDRGVRWGVAEELGQS
jgi:exopolyphosphatase / guanosine-5'-triphosphate,3'-diphosphate pyrophosphatase